MQNFKLKNRNKKLQEQITILSIIYWEIESIIDIMSTSYFDY